MNMSNLVKRMDLRGAKATLAAMLWMPRAFQPHPEPRAVPWARSASSTRGIRFALLVLALGGVLLWSAPAEAQTVEGQNDVWSADMLVVEYTEISIGAASADLFSNIGGSTDLQIKSLWSYIPGRDLRLSFEGGVPDAADYTLQVGDLTLEFPEESSGNSSFKWTDVDVDWEDGQTIPVSIVQTSAPEEPEEQEEPAANTPASGAPTISGTAQVDETLTAETSSIADDDGLTNVSYSYRWTRSNGSTYADLAGETGSTYTLVYADQGKTVKVKVSFTDDADNDETLTSEATEVVTAAPNRAATGEPTISGTPQVDQTLTAATSDIADEDGVDGVSYNYQWMADDVNIDGASASTYVPANGDAGKAIKVSVSFTDDRDNAETRTSVATATVDATVPTQPLSLTVAAGDEIQELDASWQAPSSNGGSAVTGYKLQWKEAADSWDTEADVSESTVTGTTHTITGLTGGVEYAVQVIATNTAGDGPASAEAAGTPAEATSQQTTEESTSLTVSSIAITSDTGDEDSTWDDDGVYGIGDTIEVTVTFSEDVTVTGSPQLELDVGGAAKAAEYKSTDGSKVVFGYTVAEGDSDTDGIAIGENKLTPNGGSIKDAEDNAANLTHDALAAQADHQVDGVRPTISLVALGYTTGGVVDDTFIIGQELPFAVKFSEEVIADGSPQLTLDFDSGPKQATFFYIRLPCLPSEIGASDIVLVSSNGCLTSDTRGLVMVFSYTISMGDEDSDGLGIGANALSANGTISDAAGNEAVLTHEAVADSSNHKIDGVPPEVTSIEIISDPGEDDTYAAGDIIKLNVTFSERLEVLWQYPRLRLDIGDKARMAYRVRRNPLDIRAGEIGYVMAYSYTVQDGDKDDDGISIPANALHRLWGELQDTNGNEVELGHEALASDASHKVATTFVESTDTTAKTGLLTITGTLRVGEIVTADLSNLTDDDGLDYAADSAHYAWGREGGGLYFEAMRDPRYVIAAADKGKKLRVDLQFFDDNGNKEYRRSAWTDPVGLRAPSNNSATGAPTITGTPQVDQTLTANTSSIDDGDGLDSVSYSYQWIRSDNGADTDMAGETDSTYTLVLADLGKTIKVQVTFTDDADNDETLTSEATVAVAATVPSAPQSMTVTSGSQIQELDASWQAPSSNGGSAVTGYKLQWKEAADSWDTEADVSEATETGTTHTIPGLTGGVEYAVRVIASNTAGDGPASAEAAGTPAGGTSQQQTGDSTSPTVSSIAITSDPGSDEVYAIGDAIQITVTFSSDVTVTGSPQLELDNGGEARAAEHESSAGSEVVFAYTVEDGDSDTDGIAISENKLSLNGGTIKDADDNAANLAHSALAAEAGHKVDGIRPTISSISLGGSTRVNPNPYIIGELITVHVRFTEEIFLEGAPHITVDPESGAQTADFWYIVLPCPILDGADTATLVSLTPEEEESTQNPYECFTSETQGMRMVFSYRVKEGDLDEDGLGLAADALNLNGGSLRDAAGNAAVITHEPVAESASNLIDGVPPVITSIEIISDPGEDETYAAGDAIKFNITFSEKLKMDSSLPRLRLDMGDKARMAYWYRVERSPLDIEEDVTGFIMAYSYTVVEGDNDDNGISFPASPVHALWSGVSDLNGNDAALEYEAIPDNPGHKVATSSAGSGGEASDDTEKTGHLTITGTLKVGETVFADFSNVDDEDGVEYAVSTAYFSWSREGGGGGLLSRFDPRYIIGGSDKGKRLKVSTEFFDDNGNKEYLISPWTEPVGPRAPSNSAPTGLPTITGTPQVDQTLTANTSSIDDGDGLDSVSYSYQWIRSDNGADTDIAGETDSTYTLVLADLGKTIKVRVTFTDDADNAETLTSVATVAVAAAPNRDATGQPTISGTPQVDETLTADTSAISDEDGLSNVSYQYQWLRDDADITGQTNSTHRLVSADEGKTIKVRVTFRDDADNAESLTSVATTAVAARPTPAVLLTASFANVPADHNGDNFTFQLNFSENVNAGYARIRDHAFTVDGATIANAYRQTQGSNQGWHVEVTPSETAP